MQLSQQQIILGIYVIFIRLLDALVKCYQWFSVTNFFRVVRITAIIGLGRVLIIEAPLYYYYRFPDVIPKPTPDSKFSMTAGDFLEVYTNSDEWHCVATCFFIDCAPNVVQFIETIYRILKPGGLWINLGPLLYHYSDIKNEKSVEPSFQVVSQIINNVGFVMEKCETGVKTKYCQNPKSMLQYEYDSVFFVCRKPISLDILKDAEGFSHELS